MPGWSKKDQRHNERASGSRLDDAESVGNAVEIAAPTVNKQRPGTGKSTDLPTAASGDPNSPLENRTVDELRHRASQLDISGRSNMLKEELIEAIRDQNR